MAFLKANGATLAYGDSVVGGKPSFLFLPSWACDSTVWTGQVRALAGDYRSLQLDFRGVGGSPATTPLGIREAADDAAALLRHLVMDPVIVVGHSFGGLAGLLANHRYPELFCGVVVVDPPLNAAAEGRFNDLAAAIREAGSMGEFDDYVDSFFVDETPAEAREHVREMMLECPPEVAAGQLEDAEFLTEAIARLVTDADEKPFMAVWPEEPLGNPERLRELTRFLRQEPVAGAGHFVMLDRPAVFTALLKDFVDEVRRDPRLQHRD